MSTNNIIASRCPNCYAPVVDHPDNGCVLAVLIDQIADRGFAKEGDLVKLHANCNMDLLWERLDPIIDDLEEGNFSTGE